MTTPDADAPEATMWEGRYIVAKKRGRWEYVTRARNIRAAVILALDGEEFRDWQAVTMPGTYATRKKLQHLVEKQSPRFPWMVRLNEAGLALRAHLAAQENDHA